MKFSLYLLNELQQKIIYLKSLEKRRIKVAPYYKSKFWYITEYCVYGASLFVMVIFLILFIANLDPGFIRLGVPISFTIMMIGFCINGENRGPFTGSILSKAGLAGFAFMSYGFISLDRYNQNIKTNTEEKGRLMKKIISSILNVITRLWNLERSRTDSEPYYKSKFWYIIELLMFALLVATGFGTGAIAFFNPKSALIGLTAFILIGGTYTITNCLNRGPWLGMSIHPRKNSGFHEYKKPAQPASFVILLF